MNLKNYDNYIKISKTIATRFFNLYKQTYVCNSISKQDLISIAFIEMLEITRKHQKICISHKKNKTNIPKKLEACIVTGVTGKMYNVINRECIKHNDIFVVVSDPDKSKYSTDLNTEPVIDLYTDIKKLEIGKQHHNYFFSIEELSKCLNENEYKLIFMFYVKNYSITRIAKNMKKNRVYITSLYKSSLEKIKKYLILTKDISTS